MRNENEFVFIFLRQTQSQDHMLKKINRVGGDRLSEIQPVLLLGTK